MLYKLVPSTPCTNVSGVSGDVSDINYKLVAALNSDSFAQLYAAQITIINFVITLRNNENNKN